MLSTFWRTRTRSVKGVFVASKHSRVRLAPYSIIFLHLRRWYPYFGSIERSPKEQISDRHSHVLGREVHLKELLFFPLYHCLCELTGLFCPCDHGGSSVGLLSDLALRFCYNLFRSQRTPVLHHEMLQRRLGGAAGYSHLYIDSCFPLV